MALSFLESVTVFFVKNDQPVQSEDSTLYRIETAPHEYVGRIVYQNDTVIKFRKESGERERLVKILKSNIKSITVLQA